MPCRDQKAWQKTNGIPVKPPVHEKHVGRPSKKRRKGALGSEDGLKMSRHGTISHCGLCNSTDHNKRTCPHRGEQGEALGETCGAGEKRKKLPVKRNITYDKQVQ